MTRSAPDFSEPLQQAGATHVWYRGRKLLYFGGCDYFRLSVHPAVRRALNVGLKKFGLNTAASRFTTGNHILYERLEAELRDFFRAPTAIVTSNGYCANLVAAQALAGEFSHALIDAGSHQSLRDSTAYLECPVIQFNHADPAAVKRKLKSLPLKSRVLLLTDGMFGHNGRLAPLRDYLEMLPSGSRMLVDDAHGAGTLGEHGRGACEVLGIDPERVIQTISLSKAFGVYGGAILGSGKLRRRIVERGRLLRGNTPLPLPLANAALTAVSLLRRDQKRRLQLQRNIAQAARAFPEDVNPGSPILAISARSPTANERLSEKLLARGIHPPLIFYGTAGNYFRFALSSEHRPLQIQALLETLALESKNFRRSAKRALRRPAP